MSTVVKTCLTDEAKPALFVQVGAVAQSVEQWPFKPLVVGSIPTGSTRSKNILLGISLFFYALNSLANSRKSVLSQ